MRKNTVEPDTPQMTIRRMRISYLSKRPEEPKGMILT